MSYGKSGKSMIPGTKRGGSKIMPSGTTISKAIALPGGRKASRVLPGPGRVEECAKLCGKAFMVTHGTLSVWAV